jgi:hypothetical protein
MLFFVFCVLPVLMAFGFVIALGRTSGSAVAIRGGLLVALWLGATGGLAAAGVLDHFDPPRLPPLLFVIVGWLIWAWRSDWGDGLTRLPLKLLVGFQAFRIPVELGIHDAATRGVAPMEMSWSGWNYDIVTGVTALLIAPFVLRLPTWALHAWNAMGLALVLWVVVVGVVSMPTPFQLIETQTENTWIATFPFIWLPCVHVALAWLGHLLLFKRLRRHGQDGQRPISWRATS